MKTNSKTMSYLNNSSGGALVKPPKVAAKKPNAKRPSAKKPSPKNPKIPRTRLFKIHRKQIQGINLKSLLSVK